MKQQKKKIIEEKKKKKNRRKEKEAKKESKQAELAANGSSHTRSQAEIEIMENQDLSEEQK